MSPIELTRQKTRLNEKEFAERCDFDGVEKQSYHDKHLSSVFSRSEIEKKLFQSLEEGLKSFGDDFYIVQLHYQNPDMPNQIFFYYINRKSMPTPHWHQNVYHGSKKNGLSLVWSIPHKQMPDTLIDPQQNKFKELFVSGELLKMVKEREKKGY